jgi:hypothetical protein
MKPPWRVLILLVGFMVAISARGSCSPVEQSSVVTTFRDANSDYMQGHFDRAAQTYRHAIEQGAGGGAIWYDLGNCYFQLSDLGRARLCYERAMRLSPRDADLRHNLAMTKRRIADEDPVFRAALLADQDPLQLAAGCFTLNELAVLTSLCYFVATLALWGWLRRRGSGRASGLAWLAATATFGMLVWGALLVLRLHAGTQAVVLQPTAILYSGPGKEFNAGVALHAGTEVHVERSEGEWSQVSAYGRANGWLRTAELETL